MIGDPSSPKNVAANRSPSVLKSLRTWVIDSRSVFASQSATIPAIPWVMKSRTYGRPADAIHRWIGHDIVLQVPISIGIRKNETHSTHTGHTHTARVGRHGSWNSPSPSQDLQETTPSPEDGELMSTSYFVLKKYLGEVVTTSASPKRVVLCRCCERETHRPVQAWYKFGGPEPKALEIKGENDVEVAARPERERQKGHVVVAEVSDDGAPERRVAEERRPRDLAEACGGAGVAEGGAPGAHDVVPLGL